MAQMQPPELRFTLARGQNQFFVELAEALAYELRALGVTADITVGEIPLPQSGRVHVFISPHEYVSHSRHRPPHWLLRRSIVISAEQPRTHFFAANVPLARDAGAVFDINHHCVRAYRSYGIDASRIRLGHTALWDRFGAPGAQGEPGNGHQDRRDIDVLFLGRLTQRREEALASYADTFERLRCHIALSDHERAHTENGATFVAGEPKRDLLARAKVLLNVHGEDEPYFEWLRVTEAICAGCAVVSEHSSDIEPLEWGKHILTGEVGSLALLCSWLVDDVSLRERIRTDAYELLASELPLSAAARQLSDAARQLDPIPVPRHVQLAGRQERARGRFREAAPRFEHQPAERTGVSEGEALVLRAAKRQLLALEGLRRQIARMDFVASGGQVPQTRLVAESDALRTTSPKAVSVVMPLFNQREYVLDALGSLQRSTWSDWEVVIVDDASTDGGGEAVIGWIEAHPELACRLVRHDLNEGLPAARNTGVEEARSDRLLMLDADNEIRRMGIGRLMEALDAEPGASFAYGMLERFSADGLRGLLSCFPWDRERLRGGNYIDALALIRRDAIVAMHGYACDPRLHGLEDYDLWSRMAEAGRWGAFVPQIVGRYRVGRASMISQTVFSTTDAYAALVEHAPRLLAGIRIPR
jgi:hypothetical protein